MSFLADDANFKISLNSPIPKARTYHPVVARRPRPRDFLFGRTASALAIVTREKTGEIRKVNLSASRGAQFSATIIGE
jgi:hypothetical protein